jgi:hypothetical protein
MTFSLQGGHQAWKVCGLQSTREARTLEQLDKDGGELTDFVSTAKLGIMLCIMYIILLVHFINLFPRGAMQTPVEKHFPAPYRNEKRRSAGLLPPPKSNGASAYAAQDEPRGSSSNRCTSHVSFEELISNFDYCLLSLQSIKLEPKGANK